MWKQCKAYFTDGRFDKSVASELVTRLVEHNVTQAGGQLAYFTLLSIFPFLIYVNALIGVLNLNPLQIREFLNPIFPGDVVSLITTYIDYVSDHQSLSLLSIGIVISIFSASKSVRALSTVLDTAYGVEHRRGFWWNLGFSLLFIFGMGLMVAALAIIVPLGESFFLKLTDLFGLSDRLAVHLNLWRWAVTVAVLFCVLALMYWFVPNRRLKLKHILPGALFGMVGFVFLTRGFSIYVTYFLQNSALYGSINAIILLLLWLYCAGLIIAVGAEINGALESRRETRLLKHQADDGREDPRHTQ